MGDNYPTEGLPLAARMIEQERGKSLRSLILEDYQGKNAEQIALELGVSTATLYRWLRAIGLQFDRILVAANGEQDPPIG